MTGMHTTIEALLQDMADRVRDLEGARQVHLAVIGLLLQAHPHGSPLREGLNDSIRQIGEMDGWERCDPRWTAIVKETVEQLLDRGEERSGVPRLRVIDGAKPSSGSPAD